MNNDTPLLTATMHAQHGRWPQAVSVDDFRRNLAAVHARMAAACQRVGRDPAGVRLLPVSKTKPEASLRLAYAAVAACWEKTSRRRQAASGKRWRTWATCNGR